MVVRDESGRAAAENNVTRIEATVREMGYALSEAPSGDVKLLVNELHSDSR